MRVPHLSVSSEDRRIIADALEHLGLDPVTRDAWQRQLEHATATGWFCPSDPKELGIAITTLEKGGEVPSFPRSG